MKLTIRVKLLLIILIANTALVLAIYVANKLAFEKSFSKYIENTSRVQLQDVIAKVSQTYETQGSLAWVYKGSDDWESLVHLYYELARDSGRGGFEGYEGNRPPPPRDDSRPPRPRRYDEANTRPPKPRRAGEEFRRPEERRQPPPRPTNRRLLLKDADGQLLMGNAQNTKNTFWFPIYQSDHLSEPKYEQVIAYLGIEGSGLIRNEFDQLFAKQQQQQFILIALIALLVTVLLAVPFSKYMVKPIVQLRRNAKVLTQGDYSAQVDISSKDELGLLARDMNRLADTLAQNQIARQQWIADISHELRTPIAVIRAELEAMIDGIIDSTPEQLMSLHEEIQRLTRLVEDLHQLSLSDRGALTYHMDTHNLYDILSRTFAKNRHQIDTKHLTFSLQCSENLELDCDEQRLGQLFDNLLQNTLRYTDSSLHQPGVLDVKVSQHDGETKICWQDSAPGVSISQIDKLFDRLYRVEGARSREAGGSGLGLAICQSIVLAHNGEISAGLSELGGLAIMITLRH
ncbi:ATP-binding protein [Pseudoalteromonas byunsanensis]|uniref:histidine kinase n=1 Tax=Pseudoalteromonas byunsanensis TaxID=327939 RepID=A0A1S1N6X2_9GAMM|nr:ATP-binding protein [Pseudoalteromonas byunsanensis]OHU95082.1 two-component sensor histidine kinase [Pseudoalteromonas byunsanensis]